MEVRFVKKSGHRFFVFFHDGVSRTVCVDGWINSSICPGFCHPSLVSGWEPLSDKCNVIETPDTYIVVCPTCFGFLSRRGLFRNTGSFHMNLVLDKAGLSQFLYNYIF